MRSELAEYANEPEFIDFFEFVVNIGVLNAPFLPHLLEFAKHFVDSKKRQMRLQVFAMVNKLPRACPPDQDRRDHALLPTETRTDVVPMPRTVLVSS